MTSDEGTVDSLMTGLNTTKNPYTVGHYLGEFIRLLLAVELPQTNDSSLQYYTPTTV